ncbi:hypothetical protein XU18_0033 [Perkinsela sp. CCAP 1560/4]|nr:hypothetical protein XU18_0033 [Perkinsela sp. CCAP 1560/4]|eukprot:KNH09348.1 hypothetical protein XU18_0033 [Perkinsela sp. CCAP 1560/4]
MQSIPSRREVLHRFLRETTEWSKALVAIMDSIHHGIPLLPVTVGKALTVMHHNCESIDPSANLMKYYNQYIEVPRRKLLSGSHDEMRTSMDSTSPRVPKHEDYMYPYHRFYQLCAKHRDGWEVALSLVPSGHYSNFEYLREDCFQEFNLGERSFWNDESLQLLVDVCRLCGQWQHGCALFHRMKPDPSKISSDLLSTVLHAYAVGRRWHQALSLFGKFAKTDRRINASAYDRIINACYRASKYDKVNRVLQEILTIGVIPHENTVRMCLHAAEEEGQWTYSLLLLRSLQKNNLQVSMLMYEETIRALLCNGMLSDTFSENAWCTALDLIQEIKTNFKASPSPYLQELVLAAWIRRKQTSAEAAYTIFKQAERRHVIKRNSRLLITAMLEKTFYERKWGIFFAMKHRLYENFPERNACETNLIIAATALSGHWWGAIAIWLRNRKCAHGLCPQNRALILACATNTNDPLILRAVQDEIVSSNKKSIDTTDHNSREMANIELLVKRSLVVQKQDTIDASFV